MPAAQLIAIDPDALDRVLDRLESLERKLDAVKITPPPRWITIQEYAGKVGKSVPTVRKWKAQGKVWTVVVTFRCLEYPFMLNAPEPRRRVAQSGSPSTTSTA